jgi:hypothetical protein
MPIYALDSHNNTYNQSVNSTHQLNNNTNYHEKVHDQSVDLEDTTSDKYSEVQDLRLKIMEILEGIRLAKDENEFRPEISQLMNASSQLKRHKRYLIPD